MPRPAGPVRRRVAAAVLAGALALGAAGTIIASCGPSKQSSNAQSNTQSNTHRGAGAVQDVQRLLDGLAGARDSTYTAVYATAGGAAVVVAQAPPQYAYQGGAAAYLLAPESAYLCRTAPPGCQPSPGADGVSPSQARAISAALGGGFLPVEAVAARMAAVVAQPGARATRAQRTVAGGPAECVAVVPAVGSGLLACVNGAGILVFFAGTAEAGNPVHMELQRFSATVAPHAFEPPQLIVNDTPR